MAEFDGVTSSIWYGPTKKHSQMFRFYAKLKAYDPDGTILWRARPSTNQVSLTDKLIILQPKTSQGNMWSLESV
jgi:hypothetical protein